ncbi:uncharacterized protein METZ01_LOCUS46791 [marine metagenome]|uniref:Uncharacterized protein n=1 Tax=marine metagenome TaxID=408172 RepID=A0A381RVD7_9ZZZZ
MEVLAKHIGGAITNTKAVIGVEDR